MRTPLAAVLLIYFAPCAFATLGHFCVERSRDRTRWEEWLLRFKWPTKPRFESPGWHWVCTEMESPAHDPGHIAMSGYAKDSTLTKLKKARINRVLFVIEDDTEWVFNIGGKLELEDFAMFDRWIPYPSQIQTYSKKNLHAAKKPPQPWHDIDLNQRYYVANMHEFRVEQLTGFYASNTYAPVRLIYLPTDQSHPQPAPSGGNKDSIQDSAGSATNRVNTAPSTVESIESNDEPSSDESFDEKAPLVDSRSASPPKSVS